MCSLGECCSHVGAILSSNKLTEKYINRYWQAHAMVEEVSKAYK